MRQIHQNRIFLYNKCGCKIGPSLWFTKTSLTRLCVRNVLLLKYILNCTWINTNMKCVLNDSVLLILQHPTCPVPSLPSHTTLHHLLYKSSTGKLILSEFHSVFWNVNMDSVDLYHLWHSVCALRFILILILTIWSIISIVTSVLCCCIRSVCK